MFEKREGPFNARRRWHVEKELVREAAPFWAGAHLLSNADVSRGAQVGREVVLLSFFFLISFFYSPTREQV